MLQLASVLTLALILSKNVYFEITLDFEMLQKWHEEAIVYGSLVYSTIYRFLDC